MPTTASDLTEELDRQLATMQRLGYAKIARMSTAALEQLVAPLRGRLRELPPAIAKASIPFVLVLEHCLISAEEAMPLVEQDGRHGVVDMTPTRPAAFAPIDEVELPKRAAYLAVGVDTGKTLLNVTPTDVLPLIVANGRSPLTIEEGIAVLTHYPGVLRSMNAFSLLGSRSGDKRVPALWTSKGAPRLGWCWAGNPHSWLGSASCSARLA